MDSVDVKLIDTTSRKIEAQMFDQNSRENFMNYKLVVKLH